MGDRFEPRVDPRPQDRAWPPMRWPPDPETVLRNEVLSLRRAGDGDAEELFAALHHDEDWTHVAGRPAGPQAWRETVAGAEAAGRWLWVLRLVEPVGGVAAGAVVGTSSYLNVVPRDATLEIGSTGYDPQVWATRVNPAAKLLLLGFAFEELGAGRVELRTDVRNHRSQQAIHRLGARYEGTLRRHRRRDDGTVRDTVIFSVIAEEWPEVRDGLVRRLGDKQPSAGDT